MKKSFVISIEKVLVKENIRTIPQSKSERATVLNKSWKIGIYITASWARNPTNIAKINQRFEKILILKIDFLRLLIGKTKNKELIASVVNIIVLICSKSRLVLSR